MDYLKYNDINNINDSRVNEKVDYSQKDLIINEINLGKSNIIAFIISPLYNLLQKIV